MNEFIRKRNATSIRDTDPSLETQIHAIWYWCSIFANASKCFTMPDRLCIETPRTGLRMLQDGDEKVLDLADYCKVEIVVLY